MKNAAQKKTPVVVKGLRKSFGKQTVLNGIDLSVAEGETVAVLGRSGGGKSVLLRLLIGLQQPDSGSIRILDEETTGLATEELNALRKKMGFLFQQAALYDSLTVLQNVEFPLSRHTRMPEGQRRERAQDLLQQVGMEHDFDKLPSQISGGMQKRVGLARALALDPEILLLDEPTTGLDPITAGEIAKLIVELQEKRKVTSIVVTHDIHAAKIFSNRLVLLRNGNILVEGSFEDLQKSREEFVGRFLADAA